jgi:hypothetical protein
MCGKVPLHVNIYAFLCCVVMIRQAATTRAISIFESKDKKMTSSPFIVRYVCCLRIEPSLILATKMANNFLKGQVTFQVDLI